MRRATWAGIGYSTAVAALLITTAPAIAQVKEQTYRFDLPAGDLGDSLRTLGQTSHQQIIFSESAVHGKRAVALKGKFSVAEALDRLLAGSDLKVTRTSAGVLYVGNGGEVTAAPAAPAEVVDQSETIVVTGSRIRRTDVSTAAPVTTFDRNALTDRGFNQVGDMLNQITSNSPEVPESPFTGYPAGSGQTFPDLFGLGDGRTLTLINGRRMVTSASGLGARAVDVNVIPAGLIERVDVVEAGGAAVYGSDAIAGVVNYVLKKNFSGLEVDAQDGIGTKGDYAQPSFRITAGKNFAEGRGNIAADFEYSKTSPLLESDRSWFDRSPRSVTNPLNTSTSDGQPPSIYVFNGRLWRYNANGVIFTSNSTSPNALLRLNGNALQFSSDGNSVIPYDTGIIQTNSSSAIGGDGLDPRSLSTLLSGVKRYTGSLLGHFDLTDHVKLSGEFLYGHEEGTDTYGTEDISSFVGGGYGDAPISFTRSNPFLTASQIATLSAASPAFAAGAPLSLSKFFDLLPSRAGHTTTDTGRGLLSLDGDFSLGDHQFYWSASASHGETKSTYRQWAQYLDHYANATDAVRNASGQIVCAINADPDPTNDDPACIPINPFAPAQSASAAARNYVSVETGNTVRNKQDDYLATIGGDIARLPGGKLQFSAAYEHRRESATFTPSEADLEGLSYSLSVPESGAYNTDELSGELSIPLVGGDFTLPAIKRLQVDGSYRYVENSLAGKNSVWGVGVQWEPGLGLTLRASRSRNFSAPTLDEQFAPSSVSPGNPVQDPCDVTLINSGPNPTARLANCQKDFAAHPQYGSLSDFNDPAINTGLVAITTQGNPNLKNEISDTTTFGFVYQPKYIAGLTITADRIRINLKDALSPFEPNDFLSACYDSTVQSPSLCSTFSRNSQGYITTALAETFNAGFLHYHGETYNLNYAFPLSRFFRGGDLGNLDINIEATHNSLFEESVTGYDLTRYDDTTTMPRWRGRLDLTYTRGPLRIFYSLSYMPKARNGYYATIETSEFPEVAANYTHTLSMSYEIGKLTYRIGVDNLTNELPSIPTRNYGDIYGRRFFAGVNARF